MDIVSIPVTKLWKKSEAYRTATGPGWGVVDWYSEEDNYKKSVNRNKEDKTQKLLCDEYSSALLYSSSGEEFVISSVLKKI